MLKHFPAAIEHGRDLAGAYGTARGSHFGAFLVRCPATGATLRILASDGTDWDLMELPGIPWEHVSVSAKDRCPTWAEMCWVKDQFWGPDEVAIQFHPRREDYVNYHPRCLHIWKPVGVELPTPPPETVGPHKSMVEPGISAIGGLRS